jgi:hypothetical protein
MPTNVVVSQHSLSKIEDLYLKLFKVRVLSSDTKETKVSRLTTGEWKTAPRLETTAMQEVYKLFRFLFDLGLDDIVIFSYERTVTTTP